MVRRKFRNVTKKNKEAQRKKRLQVGISIFFVFLMVFSILGIYVSHRQNSVLNQFEYDGYAFDLELDSLGQYTLVTTVNEEEKVFYSLPQDTLRIPVNGNVTRVIGNTGYLAIATNLSSELIPIVDLMRFDFDRYASVLAVQAPLTNLAENISGVDCFNATAEIPIVTLVESTTTQIDVEGSCVQIQTLPNDAFLIRDRLLYSMLGILDR
jgi:hypothetical protein